MRKGPYTVIRSRAGFFNKVVCDDTVLSIYYGFYGAYEKACEEANALNSAHLKGLMRAFGIIKSDIEKTAIMEAIKQVHFA